MSLLGAGEIRELLDRHGIRPSRSLGQNFVVDPNTIERIVRASGVEAGDQVIEIGPGLGSLTVGLAAVASRVVAIEHDRHLLAPLTEVLDAHVPGADVQVIHADALELDWAAWAREHPGRWRLVANLPYNIATPVVLQILDDAPTVQSVLVMVQREVGQRLAAAPGSKEYGIPSVRAQYWANATVVGRVPATVFHPVPKVESVLVRLDRRDDVPPVDRELLWKLVRVAFGQRRKMLRRSLGGLVGVERIEAAGIDPAARPEDLGVAEWVALASSSGAHG